MKPGANLRKGTYERLQLAVMQDKNIVVHINELATSEGFPESYLLDLGMTKADLKRLEVWGFAKCGYLPLKAGRRKRWILIVGEGLKDVGKV